jgi:predicted  nucleic acid-binding Zn-ribbon protein
MEFVVNNHLPLRIEELEKELAEAKTQISMMEDTIAYLQKALEAAARVIEDLQHGIEIKDKRLK